MDHEIFLFGLLNVLKISSFSKLYNEPYEFISVYGLLSHTNGNDIFPTVIDSLVIGVSPVFLKVWYWKQFQLGWGGGGGWECNNIQAGWTFSRIDQLHTTLCTVSYFISFEICTFTLLSAKNKCTKFQRIWRCMTSNDTCLSDKSYLGNSTEPKLRSTEPDLVPALLNVCW